MDHQRVAYLALTQVPGLGPARLHTLLSIFHTPIGAHSAPFEFLCSLPGFSRAFVSALKATPLDAGTRLVEGTERLGGSVLVPGDDGFPLTLGLIPDPPPVIFALGNLALLERPAVAIVGSRDHTIYGADVCRSLAREAAWNGIVVVSGMARGLDATAHAGALEVRGGTIGVLGNGLGVVYPAANRGLYERVAEHGLLLTEFPPGERPHAGSFPRRNRLISGLARVTVVVEAAAGSGALITAGTALEQGRDVLAVPGPITSAVSVGTNRLIRDGATPYLEPADLLQHYPEATPIDRTTEPAGPDLPGTLTADERDVARLLGPDSVHIDDIASRLARPVSGVLAVLCGLEIAGIAEQLPGKMFRRSTVRR
ncbi:MAG TPA: DNA-processing protein DprA [Gemmatimonadales bacterium]|jgi:DNA processing protein